MMARIRQASGKKENEGQLDFALRRDREERYEHGAVSFTYIVLPNRGKAAPAIDRMTVAAERAVAALPDVDEREVSSSLEKKVGGTKDRT